MNPLISFDLDGVLADFKQAVLPLANAVRILRSGRPPIPVGYSPSDWDWTDALIKQDWDRIWSAVKSTDNFWVNVPPYDDQVRAVRLFQRIRPSVPVVFITSRAKSNGLSPADQSRIWTTRQGLTGDVYRTARPSDKRALMIELSVTHSLDDKPETVAECNTIPGHKAFLMDRSWNRQSDQPRVFSAFSFLFEVLRDLKGAPGCLSPVRY